MNGREFSGCEMVTPFMVRLFNLHENNKTMDIYNSIVVLRDQGKEGGGQRRSQMGSVLVDRLCIWTVVKMST